MSILTPIPDAEAVGETAAIFADERESLGYVPIHTKVLARNPAASRAWESLTGAIVRSMGLRRYELVTLAAAKALGSDACRLAHGKKSLGCFDEDQLVRIAANYRDADLSDAEVAAMDFATRLSGTSSTMTEADAQRLRDVGFDDAEIVDIALAAGARNYFSRVLHALAIDVDVPPGLSPELEAALRT